jgi:putative flippase GtrA
MSLSFISTCLQPFFNFKFIRFCIVGGLTAGIFFVTLWFFQSIINANYFVAINFSYIFSTIFHYLANSVFTFQSQGAKQFQQLFRYFALWIINYLITLALVSISVKIFFLSSYFGSLIAILITVLTGYLLSHSWIFTRKEF